MVVHEGRRSADQGACYVSWVACCFSYNVNSSSGSSALGVGVGAAGGGGASGAGLNSSSSAPLRPSAPPAIQVTAPTPTEKKQARVLYDYDAADSSELSLLADEVTYCFGILPHALALLTLRICCMSLSGFGLGALGSGCLN